MVDSQPFSLAARAVDAAARAGAADPVTRRTPVLGRSFARIGLRRQADKCRPDGRRGGVDADMRRAPDAGVCPRRRARPGAVRVGEYAGLRCVAAAVLPTGV